MDDRGGGEGLAPDELRALLQIRALPGLTDRRLRGLLDRYGSARAALTAPATELGERAARARDTRPIRGRVERAIEVIDRLDVRVITERDPWYPPGLRELHDPPPVLFTRGRLEALGRPAVAIVGARRHSTYGAEVATALARDLVRAGVAVVSGMARGIDAAAHAAALAGDTIGVLGCGIDVVYPRANERLYEAVAAAGLLLSEFVPGEPAFRHHFPRRNRLIAALARCVVVVEASRKSGSLITVDHALDLGREVFAVPGPIGRATSEGTNALIQEGARLATGAGEILAELGIVAPADPGAGSAAQRSGAAATAASGGSASPEGLKGEGLAVWRALADEPQHVDALAARCGLDPAAALVRLLELELRGSVRQLAGMRFVRI